MKNLLLTLLLLPCLLNAQDIPKRTSIIKVEGVSFSEIMDSLLNKNILIDKYDKDLKTIDTKKSEYRNCLVAMNIRIKDSIAFIQGFVSLGMDINVGAGVVVKDQGYRIEYKGEKAGIFKKGFAYMNAFALSFNKPVEYIVQ